MVAVRPQQPAVHLRGGGGAVPGFLQQAITRRTRVWLGILIASLLFGVAHLAGGPLLVLFATLAGACYGLAFHLSRRLGVAILLHFLFNFAHLALFTYPLASH